MRVTAIHATGGMGWRGGGASTSPGGSASRNRVIVAGGGRGGANDCETVWWRGGQRDSPWAQGRERRAPAEPAGRAEATGPRQRRQWRGRLLRGGRTPSQGAVAVCTAEAVAAMAEHAPALRLRAGGNMANGVQSGSGAVPISSLSVAAQADSGGGRRPPGSSHRDLTGGYAPSVTCVRIYGPRSRLFRSPRSWRRGPCPHHGHIRFTRPSSAIRGGALYEATPTTTPSSAPAMTERGGPHFRTSPRSGLTPPSPANNNNPRSRERPTPNRRKVYASPDCSGTPVATEGGAAFGSPGWRCMRREHHHPFSQPRARARRSRRARAFKLRRGLGHTRRRST
jgi:hypothetical protein